uniref:Phosphatidylinositol 3-kinase vps34 n=1 Tax=Lygus hesperus TaxID=30085 RepID=A0A0A9YVV0_LYGHE
MNGEPGGNTASVAAAATAATATTTAMEDKITKLHAGAAMTVPTYSSQQSSPETSQVPSIPLLETNTSSLPSQQDHVRTVMYDSIKSTRFVLETNSDDERVVGEAVSVKPADTLSYLKMWDTMLEEKDILFENEFSFYDESQTLTQYGEEVQTVVEKEVHPGVSVLDGGSGTKVTRDAANTANMSLTALSPSPKGDSTDISTPNSLPPSHPAAYAAKVDPTAKITRCKVAQHQ